MGLGGRTIENGRGASSATRLNKPSATAAKNAAREAKFKLVSAWRPLRFVLRHVAGRGGIPGGGNALPRSAGAAGQALSEAGPVLGKGTEIGTGACATSSTCSRRRSSGAWAVGPPQLRPWRGFPPRTPPFRRQGCALGKRVQIACSLSNRFVPTQRAEASAVCWLVAQRRKSKQIRPPADHSRQTDERRWSASRFL